MANVKGKDFFQVLCFVEGIKMEWILKKEWWKNLSWINLAQGFYEHGSKSPESHKDMRDF
jgi:hypothetical protein